MNRGSGTHSKGDPIYMIETVYLDHSKFKVFTSESGFRAGLRAVDWDVSFSANVNGIQHGGAQARKTYILSDPQWKEFVAT